MENCMTREYENKCVQKMSWQPFLRQLLVCSGPWTLFFVTGLNTGFPTVLVPQLRRANQTISDDLASWLPAAFMYSSIPWVIAMSALTVGIGRKRSHIIACISGLCGFTIFFFSTNITHFLIGEMFHGLLLSTCLTSSIAVMTEFVSAKYRGVFLSFKAACFFWGVLTSNVIGTFFHWQYIAISGMACGLYSLVNVIVWPDSPLWLASKGKFKECAVAHRWLKGDDVESERELGKMLKSNENRRFVKEQWSLRKGIKAMAQKQFMKPILISIALICLHAFSGKMVCTVYAIDILKKITNSEKTAYVGMLILDGVSVLSMYLGCFISKKLKRRVMLIGFSSVCVTFTILISVYLFITNLSIINENKYVSIGLLAGYSISASCGPMILTLTIIGELLPVEFRALSMCIIALIFKSINGTLTKITPFIFRTLAMSGMFALFAVVSVIFLVIIYFYLPETKDKTLQEISDCLNRKDTKITEESSGLVNVKIRKLAIN